MSYRKSLIRLMDRPGGRSLLGKIATRAVRRLGASGVEILYQDGFWMRRVGPDYFPQGPKFDFQYDDFSTWPKQMDRYISDAHDYWLRFYAPKEGDVIVDVGAGRGEDTVAFSRAVGKTGRVIAIEAHPVSFAILEKFCRLNNLENVSPLNLAVMDRPGIVHISSSDSWVLNAVESGNGSSLVEVRASTLVEICDKLHLEKIAFLKMNIEGAERYALEGVAPARSRIDQICVACHDFRSRLGHGEQFRTRASVEKFLTSNGFEIRSRPHDPRDYVRDHIFGEKLA